MPTFGTTTAGQYAETERDRRRRETLARLRQFLMSRIDPRAPDAAHNRAFRWVEKEAQDSLLNPLGPGVRESIRDIAGPGSSFDTMGSQAVQSTRDALGTALRTGNPYAGVAPGPGFSPPVDRPSPTSWDAISQLSRALRIGSTAEKVEGPLADFTKQLNPFGGNFLLNPFGAGMREAFGSRRPQLPAEQAPVQAPAMDLPPLQSWTDFYRQRAGAEAGGGTGATGATGPSPMAAAGAGAPMEYSPEFQEILKRAMGIVDQPLPERPEFERPEYPREPTWGEMNKWGKLGTILAAVSEAGAAGLKGYNDPEGLAEYLQDIARKREEKLMRERNWQREEFRDRRAEALARYQADIAAQTAAGQRAMTAAELAQMPESLRLENLRDEREHQQRLQESAAELQQRERLAAQERQDRFARYEYEDLRKQDEQQRLLATNDLEGRAHAMVELRKQAELMAASATDETTRNKYLKQVQDYTAEIQRLTAEIMQIRFPRRP